MLKTNYHSHSEFCDGTGLLEEYVTSAINKEFDIFGFSGHAPLPFKNDWTMSKKDLLPYLIETKRLKENYKNDIELKIGLEIDYIENKMTPADKFYQDLELDFIIGSVHVLPDKNTGEYLGVEYTKKEMEQLINDTYGGNARQLVKEYYRLLRSMSSNGGFDIIGHIDVIKKTNVNSIYFDETEKWYKDEIELTLQYIAKNKQILEVNTGQVLNNPERIYPSPWILKMANEYDIPIMLNSDAHRPERLDNYFDEAKAIILDAGYT
ncbi:MAG: histidinol-phosphatase, partial [Spirochaetaceae bacterium]|nr:histidinol-phosphatase [Spirochaetaceae bacterium]